MMGQRSKARHDSRKTAILIRIVKIFPEYPTVALWLVMMIHRKSSVPSISLHPVIMLMKLYFTWLYGIQNDY